MAITDPKALTYSNWGTSQGVAYMAGMAEVPSFQSHLVLYFATGLFYFLVILYNLQNISPFKENTNASLKFLFLTMLSSYH